MTDINSITIIGRLTKDAEISYTPGGMAIANLSIALNRSEKKGNEWVEVADYFDVKSFGNQAKNLGPFLKKGKQIGIEGYLRQERWEKDGQKKSRVVINANNIQLLGDKKDGGQRNGNGYDTGYEREDYGYSE